MKRIEILVAVLLFVPIPVAGRQSAADDWPMWRYDARRGNGSPDELPEDLKLEWSRQLPAPKPAWPKSQTKLQFDAVQQPIVADKLLILGSTVDDSITAYETESGKIAWRFFTDGPVRFAPVAHKQRIYAVSDDGYLYCLNARDGSLHWKFNGGPRDRRIIGNDRLISSWPARGGPVIADDTVYFTASIWPFMGVFVHAVDAESGEVVWTNSETGSLWITHPHGAPSFGSVVPQGYLAVSGDSLIVPGGRSLPAVFDRRTGKLRHFQFGGKGSGGWNVAAHQQFYVAGNAALNLDGGAAIGSFTADVLTDDLLISGVTAQRLDDSAVSVKEGTDRRGETVKEVRFSPSESWPIADSGLTVFAMAGGRAYAGGNGKVAAFNVEATRQAKKSQPAVWTAPIEGRAASIIAADDRLFVMTEDARLYCFCAGDAEPKDHPLTNTTIQRVTDQWTARTKAILKQTRADSGYAVVYGVGSGRLIDELIAQSSLHLIVIDSDKTAVANLRRTIADAGLYGNRIAAFVGNPASFDLPPYVANLMVSEDVASVGFDDVNKLAESAFPRLRPYGGAACFLLSDEQQQAFVAAVEASSLAGAEVSRVDGITFLSRVGSLPGSGQWTHQYGNAANSVVSRDSLVKAPLGLLWFGGPSNDKVLPRHGHGPSPQVAGGRLVIEGADMLRCVDVYTGRVLWERDLPGLGKYYDTTSHFPGAGEIGGNYVTLADAVYVVYGDAILELDADTGETKNQFRLGADDNANPGWGFLAAAGNLLIATSSPVKVPSAAKNDEQADARRPLSHALEPTAYSSASRQLIAFDRHSGELLWQRTAEFNFRHNAIAVADGKVFCVDRMTDDKLQTLKRRGIEPTAKPRLLALDSMTGKEIWSTDEDVFGTFLNYSSEHDVLLQAGSAYRDRAYDESRRGMVAYRGQDGSVLWKDLTRSHGGPCLLWRDKIITNGGGGFQLDLLTGQPTGWDYQRMYGCNTAVGSEHLLTFRSGAAGFCDLTGDSGTGNIGGFRSSCTANLIVADGVLNAPDYTRTCSCAYQNQSSLALIHMPDAETWTFNNADLDKGPIERLGINFGAPGDRRDEQGTMWYEFPIVGGPSPKLPIKITPEDPRAIQRHSSQVSADGLPWVASSCVEGVESIEIALDPAAKTPRRYTVRLHFAELAAVQPGDRIFSIEIQGQRVLRDFDIVNVAGGVNQAVIQQFDSIEVNGTLKIELIASGKSQAKPLLAGIEIVGEAR